MIKTTKAFLFLLSLLLVLACSNDTEGTEDTKGLPIETIKAVSCVDLSDRTDWKFMVSSEVYTYEADGRSINASVKEKPYRFNPGYPEGHRVPLGGGPVLRLVSPGYYAENNTKSLPPAPPNIMDQTSPEKLLKADILSCYYYGYAFKNLTDVELIHANALLEFDCIDLPHDAIVGVESYMTITPFKNGNNYKAIVLAEGGEFDASIVVRTGGKSYMASLIYDTKSSPLSGPNCIRKNTCYTFSVRFDNINKSIVIENLSQSEWSVK